MNLEKIELIFFDFDGVVKESISVKTDAFVELFRPYGSEVCRKVRAHHIENGGMSRFDKIPLYLKWSGLEPTSKKVDEICTRFGKIVKEKVIDSEWVPGVREFLGKNNKKFTFIMVSATPQKELEYICKSLGLDSFFSKFYGSPMTKSKAIERSILDLGVSPNACLMIGDARADINAAYDNNISFIFRRHKHNQELQVDSNMQVIYDFV